MPDFEEKALCRKVGGVFELSAYKGYEPIAFTRLWLDSKTAENLYGWDFHDIAQSKQYLFHSIEIEYMLHPEDIRKNADAPENLMYWGGYTFMYLSFAERLKPADILKYYNITKILQCYDTLHTLPENVAIEEIKEHFVFHAKFIQ